MTRMHLGFSAGTGHQRNGHQRSQTSLSRNPAFPRGRVGRGARQSSGFTLIEIAIVLIIIGLLLGGVLKGNELINSAKAKNISQDFRNIQVALYGYQDKTGKLPGDDDRTTRNGADISSMYRGNGNAIITGDCNIATTASNTTEDQLLWRDLRVEGFVAGDTAPNNYAFQKNSVQGHICVISNPGTIQVSSSTSGGTTTSAHSLSGTYVICSWGVPQEIGRRIDLTLDGAFAPDKGSLWILPGATTSIPASGGNPVAPLTEATYPTTGTVVLCYGF